MDRPQEYDTKHIVHLEKNDTVIHVTQDGRVFVYKKVKNKKGVEKKVSVGAFAFASYPLAISVATNVLVLNATVRRNRIIFEFKEKKDGRNQSKHLDNLSASKMDSNSDERDGKK